MIPAVGVKFSTWAAFHREGPAVFAAVEDLLNDAVSHDLAEERLNEALVDPQDSAAEADVPEEEWMSLDEMAERRYQVYAELWEETIAEIP